MNYCTRCESFYRTPRSCNCYAAVPGTAPITVPDGTTVAPILPHATIRPYIGDVDPNSTSKITVTWTHCAVCGKQSCQEHLTTWWMRPAFDGTADGAQRFTVRTDFT